jgi:hypothetical protein
MKARKTLALHSSVAALFTSLDHSLMEYFLTRGNVECDKKVVPLILCTKQKVFV